ncbi:microtubule-associated protein 1S isoform X1 [Heterocephalus glaber]|uniref:Microtubule-associated protein 1S isoform X1 n=1 Tax=Heterocephalus glaber TaxID=10181 RepID=A0AAX6QHF8_HETGA|nr:microtubule-associated protein 1S isoform X1 [Heterocephalus glaber]
MAAAVGGALLLVVGGECGGVGPLGLVLEELERGIRAWDVDLGVCSLDQELKTFVSQHSATFSSIVRGQRSLHHRGDALETLVLLNPSDKSLCDELRNLLLVPAPHKLLVLAGPCLEETGELLLQTGGFSSHHFLQILEEREIRDLLGRTPASAEPPTLTLGCPPFGAWAQLCAAEAGLLGHRLRLNPAARLPASAGLRELLEYLAGSLEPPSPFELLEPPTSGDFLKLDPPCCYIFPGGLGDTAFFAVSDFTVLVNGGSNPKAAFWKLLRHVDRVDAVLVTHAGADSLPGVNSLLRRKVAERREAAAGASREGGPGRLASPGLGVVFLHAREPAPRLLGGEDEAEVARGLLAQLGIAPLPLRRSLPAAPTVLLEKLGVGRLDLHVLHPPASDAGAASACALLVWLPADPAEKVVRALFPGRTPPARLLDGLGRLQHLGFLREPVVTPQDLQAPRRAGSRDSVGSRDSAKARPVPERLVAARKEAPRRAPEREARPPREPKKDPKNSLPRTQPREVRRATLAAPNIKKAGAPRAVPTPSPAARNGLEPGPSLGAPGAARPCPSSPSELERPLSLSPPRDASPTTPSLPAEVGSPHSTELDESLSASLEQGPPSGEARLSLPLRAPGAPRSASPHDVDLCLVSPCEFEHRKATPAIPASPGSSQDSSAGSQERAAPEETPPASVSESLATLSDSEPLPAAPGAGDSDEDTEALGAPRDPLPEPLKDRPPLLGPPGLCMVDPEVLPPASARTADCSSRARKPLARSTSGSVNPRATPAAAVKTKGLAGGDRAGRLLSARSEPSDKAARASLARKPTVPKAVARVAATAAASPASSRPAAANSPPGPPVYLDLAYLPGGSVGSLDAEFFLRVRALCYVISGQDQHREQGLRAVLDALLDAKRQWDRDLQVTLVPTFDSVAMRKWFEETRAQHQTLGIRVLGSSSMVFTEDDAFPACKLVF